MKDPMRSRGVVSEPKAVAPDRNDPMWRGYVERLKAERDAALARAEARERDCAHWEAEASALAATQCATPVSGEYGHMECSALKAALARAEKAEGEALGWECRAGVAEAFMERFGEGASDRTLRAGIKGYRRGADIIRADRDSYHAQAVAARARVRALEANLATATRLLERCHPQRVAELEDENKLLAARLGIAQGVAQAAAKGDGESRKARIDMERRVAELEAGLRACADLVGEALEDMKSIPDFDAARRFLCTLPHTIRARANRALLAEARG